MAAPARPATTGAFPPGSPDTSSTSAPSGRDPSWRSWARWRPLLIPAAVALAAKATVLLLAFLLLGQPDSFAHDLAVKWDGEHYLCVAEDGYVGPEFYRSQPAGDFPQVCNSLHFGYGYPATINLFGGGDWGVLLASNVASLLAVIAIAWHWGPRPALFYGLFPSWLVFGSVGYSEATFVLAAAVALALLERGRTWAHPAGAALAGAFAIGTRYLGGPALLMATLPWGRWSQARRWLAFALVSAAGLVFAIWHWWYTGQPHGYLFAQTPWTGTIGTPWGHFDFLLNGWFTTQGGTIESGNLSPIEFALRDVIYLVPAIWGLAILWRQPGMRSSFAFSATILFFALFTDGLPAAGLPRHILGAFPALAILGTRLRDREAWTAYAVLAIAAGTYGLVHHLRGFFA